MRPAILGFIAVAAIIARRRAQQRSPFVLEGPGRLVLRRAARRQPAVAQRRRCFLGLVAMYGGLVLFMRVWYGLIRTLSQVKGVPVRKLVAVLRPVDRPLCSLAPPLFSRDIYSYAAQGEMMSHHISPYHYGPGVLGATPSVSLVDPLWLNTPVPYGPLFMEIDGMLTSRVAATTSWSTWSCCGCWPWPAWGSWPCAIPSWPGAWAEIRPTPSPWPSSTR